MINSAYNVATASALPKIGIMILNRNGERWLSPLYRSIENQNYPAFKIYLVDNASTDDSVHLTETQHPGVTVLKLSKNAGYSIAYNKVIPVAFDDGCDWVVWANNDLLLEPGCISEMVRAASTDERIGIVGPAFFSWTSDEPNEYMKGNHACAIEQMLNGSVTPIDVAWVEGSFLMVSKQCLKDAGGLDPYLFFYWEEADFCRRALRKQWRIVLAPKARARHFGAGTSHGNSRANSAAASLKSRNYYVYTLTNPNCPMLHNVLASVHLLLVQVKAAVKQSMRDAFHELKVFLQLIPEAKIIWAKWHRDRLGIPPQDTMPAYSDLTLEFLNHD